MSHSLKSMLIASLLMTSCQGGGENSPRGPAKNNQRVSPTPDPSNSTGGSSSDGSGGTMSGEDKCWQKMLDTPEYKACNAAGKIYNRIKKQCLDLGLTRTNDCSGIEADQIQAANTAILAVLPKATITNDQCGTYSKGGKTYAFAYVMGKQFFPADAAAKTEDTYKIQVRKICYYPEKPTLDDSTCSDPSVKVSDPAPSMSVPLGTCE